MPTKVKNISKCNHGEKSMKTKFVIYPDTESLLEKKKIHITRTQKSHQK